VNIKNKKIFGLFLFYFLSLCLNIIAYESMQPFFINIIFLFLGLLLILFFDKNNFKYFIIVNLFCFFWAGVAAIYSSFFNDPSQNGNDALIFYNVSIGDYSSVPLTFLSGVYYRLIEGLGAVYIWTKFYDFFSYLGFEKIRYIGVGVNSLLVSLTAILGLNIFTISKKGSEYDNSRFIMFYLFCGIVFLFSSIHVRDSFTLLIITYLTFIIIHELKKNRPFYTFSFYIKFLIIQIFIGFFRQDFIVVPVIFFVIAIFSMFIEYLSFNKIGFYKKILIISTITISILIVITVGFLLFPIVQNLFTTYSSHSNNNSSGDSLGLKYIVNANIIFRFFFGTIYTLIFPIPFWIGFFSNSVYDLFKSFNSIFMILILPLIIGSFIELINKKNVRRSPRIFLTLIIIVFTMVVSITSMETRHLGSFIVPFIVLASSFNKDKNIFTFKIIYKIFLSFIGGIHFLWAILKFT
jgi:hypothetical protein